ncbi:MAG: hypothetical protein JW702_05550 [Clostridiales bacterium]|nr:hypothetical protein [Clostridiales bacterium]
MSIASQGKKGWLSVSSKNIVSTKFFSLTRENLAKLKLKAVRKGCWYKVLKQKERMLLNLTISVVQRVRSFLLAKVVSRLVDVLFEALESPIYRLVKTKGQQMAQRICEVAQNWGYEAAKTWSKDVGFMQFLVVNNLGELNR